MAEASIAAKAKAKIPANSSYDEFQAAADDLFARRMLRLEEVSRLLRHLYREQAQTHIAEKQQKAAIYMASEARSHGEREGLASAQAINYSTETLTLMGDIRSLEEERDFLKFCITHDGGA